MAVHSSHESAAASDVHTADYEKSDVRPGSILLFGLGLLVVLILVLGLVTGIQVAATGRWPDLRPVTAGGVGDPNIPLPPAPRLEARPGQALQELRATEQALLHSYGWVDKEAGVVRIPIERAMELIVQRGLPARPEAEGARFRDQGEAIPLDSSSGRTMEERWP